MKNGTVLKWKRDSTSNEKRDSASNEKRDSDLNEKRDRTSNEKRDSKLNEKRDITLKELLSFCDVNVMTANHCSSRHKLNTLEVMFNVYSGLSRHVSKSKKYGFLRVVWEFACFLYWTFMIFKYCGRAHGFQQKRHRRKLTEFLDKLCFSMLRTKISV